MRVRGAKRAGIGAVALVLSLLLASAAPAAEPAIGVTVENELVIFKTGSPEKLIERRPIVGMLAGESIRAIDQRTATGELFALTSTLRVLRIDPETGATDQLGPPISTSPQFGFSAPAGVDFNPTVDRLRLVNVDDQNLRFNPVTFVPVDLDNNSANGITPDASLVYDAGDPNAGEDPAIAALAYSDNDNDPATSTTAYAIDHDLDVLATIGGVNGVPSPNNGALFTRGGLGVNLTSLAALDIVPGTVGGDGVAYLAAQPIGATSSTLYTVNLIGTAPVGQATALGEFGGDFVLGLAVIQAGTIGFGGRPTQVSERKSKATVKIRRSGESLTGSDGDNLVRVPWHTVDGSATAPSDYKATNGILTFEQGEKLAKAKIPLKHDGKREPTESFAVRLGAYASGGAVITQELGNIRIVDDD